MHNFMQWVAYIYIYIIKIFFIELLFDYKKKVQNVESWFNFNLTLKWIYILQLILDLFMSFLRW